MSHSKKTGKQLRILQVFSRYRQFGGEEGSVYRISDVLNDEYDTGIFLASTEDLFSGGTVNKGIGILKSIHNWTVVSRLKRYQQLGSYNLWLVHNVFPAMSPAVYELAFQLGIPVIQYLHNYRLGCVNGFFLNHGEPCQRCIGGNFLPALQTACWHDSHLQSGLMGAITARTRTLGLFQNVTRWIAISEAQRQEHIRMGIPADRISVIHHFLHPVEAPSPYPEQGDVIFVGRLSVEKGVAHLLRAWRIIQDCGRTLWIVGDGPEKAGLERLGDSLKLRNVKFTGFLKHNAMKEIWQRAACSIVPSIWKEPFGMVVLEAWGQGRPVVAHSIGALPELINEGKDGLLVSPDHPQEMAEAIASILRSPRMGEAMGTIGHERLLREFNSSEWIKKTQTVINGIEGSCDGQPCI